jgi:hypothetical protein
MSRKLSVEALRTDRTTGILRLPGHSVSKVGNTNNYIITMPHPSKPKKDFVDKVVSVDIIGFELSKEAVDCFNAYITTSINNNTPFIPFISVDKVNHVRDVVEPLKQYFYVVGSSHYSIYKRQPKQ